MNNINLNHEKELFLSKFICGATHANIKIGRKNYLIDVQKNKLYTYVDFYNVNINSKYSPAANLCRVRVKNNAVLTKDFFLNISEISKAQALTDRFSDILDF